MAGSVIERIRSAWNAFSKKEENEPTYEPYNGGYITSGGRPDRFRFTRGNERSIINSVYNRIAMDVAAIDIKHVRLDKHGRYESDIDSGLNRCFNLSANIDQTGRLLKQDIVTSMFDEGCVALVPTITSENPNLTSSYDIYAMRVGRITSWYPRQVRVDLYNEDTGQHQEVLVSKENCAIIENPFYSVMNEPNSTLRRLIRKMNILDVVDEQTASGKFNMIIQLPYAVRGEKRIKEAEDRQKRIEQQLNGSQYGIAYIDSAEKVTQLNRALDNNLLSQIEYLTKLLYSQLGITSAVMEGSADEQTMLNYNTRTIEPIVSAIVDECKRKFLTKTAISQGQSIMFFRDPFKLVPIGQIAEIADTFTRNEILAANDIRQIIGYPPSTDPKADQLVNSNIKAPSSENQLPGVPQGSNQTASPEEDQNVEYDIVPASSDKIGGNA